MRQLVRQTKVPILHNPAYTLSLAFYKEIYLLNYEDKGLHICRLVDCTSREPR